MAAAASTWAPRWGCSRPAARSALKPGHGDSSPCLGFFVVTSERAVETVPRNGVTTDPEGVTRQPLGTAHRRSGAYFVAGWPNRRPGRPCRRRNILCRNRCNGRGAAAWTRGQGGRERAPRGAWPASFLPSPPAPHSRAASAGASRLRGDGAPLRVAAPRNGDPCIGTRLRRQAARSRYTGREAAPAALTCSFSALLWESGGASGRWHEPPPRVHCRYTWFPHYRFQDSQSFLPISEINRSEADDPGPPSLAWNAPECRTRRTLRTGAALCEPPLLRRGLPVTFMMRKVPVHGWIAGFLITLP